MTQFKTTTKVFVRNRTTGEQFLCRNKGVLRDYLNIPLNTIAGWFRPINGVKPKYKLYNNIEIFDIDGEYYSQRESKRSLQE